MRKLLSVLCLLLCLVALTGCAAAPSTAQAAPAAAGAAPGSPAAWTAPPLTPAVPTPAAAAGLISREEAISIALTHAGISPDQARFMECEYDPDDGIKEYDVEFHAGQYEYSYEIHAETGQIRRCEKERED